MPHATAPTLAALLATQAAADVCGSDKPTVEAAAAAWEVLAVAVEIDPEGCVAAARALVKAGFSHYVCRGAAPVLAALMPVLIARNTARRRARAEAQVRA